MKDRNAETRIEYTNKISSGSESRHAFFDLLIRNGLIDLCGDFIELRALDLKSDTMRRDFARDLTDIDRFCAKYPERELYFGVAPRKTTKNGTAENCASPMVLWADIDFKSNPEERARALLREFKQPTIVVNSGGGLHCYWLLRSPVRGSVKACLSVAEAVGGDRASTDLARVLRIPCTMNHKYPSPRPVTVEEFHPDRIYDAADFDVREEADVEAYTSDFDNVTLTPEQLAELLNLLDPTDFREYGEWFGKTLAPSHETTRGSDAGFEAYCAWSTRDPKYADARNDIRKGWNSLKLGKPGNAKLGTLVSTLLKHGAELPEWLWALVDDSDPRRDFGEFRTDVPFIPLSRVESETIEWLWPSRIPLGKLTLMEGNPGIGKSWVTQAIAADLSAGRPLPGEVQRTGSRRTLFLSAEDGLADTMKPRMDALSADTEMIVATKELFTLNEEGCKLLADMIDIVKPALVVIDPLFAYIAGKVDIHRDNEAREAITRIARLAETYHCAILCVRHLTKGGRDKAIYRGIGSIAFTATARSVLLVGADASDENRRAVIQTKNNLAMMAESVGYVLDNGGFRWTGASDLTAGEVLAEEKHSSAEDRAADFLAEFLGNGPRLKSEVVAAAEEKGISERTLRRAQEKLGVNKKKLGFKDGWEWSLDDFADMLA